MSNYDKEYLKKNFNPLAAELMVPFEPEQIKQYEGFSYATPESYRFRIIQAFPNGFTLRTPIQMTDTGIIATAHFIGERDGVKYDIESSGYEAYQIGKGSGQPQKVDKSVQMAVSAALKSVCREIGLGLHLYQKEDTNPTESTTKSATTSTSTGSKTYTKKDGDYGPWDGTLKFKSGQHKDKQYKDVPTDYIEFLADKGNELCQKELDRRNQSTTTEEELDDQAIPF